MWGVDPKGKTATEVAEAGLAAMEDWMKKLGLVMNLTELGATRDMIDGMVKSTLIMTGGYKVLTEEEVRQILTESF